MKILNYISTFFIPARMGKRKNMNFLIGFLILLLGSYLIPLPYMSALSRHSYETLEEASYYNMRIFNDEFSKEIEFTEEEQEIYETITFNELKNMNFQIVNKKVKEDTTNNYELGKDYVLKRLVDYYDENGTIINQEIYFIHIVFDLFEDLDNQKYDISKKFDSLDNEEGIFRHFLLLFYTDSFMYRNEYLKSSNQTSVALLYDKTTINFQDMESLSDLSHKIIDMIIPHMKSQYTFNGFILVLLLPIVVSLVAWIVIRKNGQLSSFKHFFNIAAICSISVILVVFCLEWIPIFIRIGIMDYYVFLFAIYYFIVITFINRQQRIE